MQGKFYKLIMHKIFFIIIFSSTGVYHPKPMYGLNHV